MKDEVDPIQVNKLVDELMEASTSGRLIKILDDKSVELDNDLSFSIAVYKEYTYRQYRKTLKVFLTGLFILIILAIFFYVIFHFFL